MDRPGIFSGWKVLPLAQTTIGPNATSLQKGKYRYQPPRVPDRRVP